jgi:hypothetical protein
MEKSTSNGLLIFSQHLDLATTDPKKRGPSLDHKDTWSSKKTLKRYKKQGLPINKTFFTTKNPRECPRPPNPSPLLVLAPISYSPGGEPASVQAAEKREEA